MERCIFVLNASLFVAQDLEFYNNQKPCRFVPFKAERIFVPLMMTNLL